jgi:hypothetical protein
MVKRIGALALAFLCSLVFVSSAPARAEPLPGTGQTFSLANAVAASAAQSFASYPKIGYARKLTLCVSSSATTTFTVTSSIGGTVFYAETIEGATTSANVTTSGAGSLCETITPASYVKVTTSAAVTVTIEVQAAY